MYFDRWRWMRGKSNDSHLCVLGQSQAGWCHCCWNCVWLSRWRCCKAVLDSGPVAHRLNAASPGSLFFVGCAQSEHKWWQNHWSGSDWCQLDPIVAPPHFPPLLAREGQMEAGDLGTWSIMCYFALFWLQNSECLNRATTIYDGLPQRYSINQRTTHYIIFPTSISKQYFFGVTFELGRWYYERCLLRCLFSFSKLSLMDPSWDFDRHGEQNCRINCGLIY